MLLVVWVEFGIEFEGFVVIVWGVGNFGGENFVIFVLWVVDWICLLCVYLMVVWYNVDVGNGDVEFVESFSC